MLQSECYQTSSGHQTSFQSTPASNFKYRASNCVLLTISVICVCVLVVCGVKIVREYALAKSYESSTCRISKMEYTPTPLKCMFCGAGAKDKTKEKGAGSCVESSFPCLHIIVEYKVGHKTSEGTLHPDSLQAAGVYAQCSFDVCVKKPEDNVIAVKEYAKSWEGKYNSNTTFTCYYSTENSKDVIVEKKHSEKQVIHSMVWPAVIVVICGIIFLHLEMKRRGINFCGGDPKAAHDGDDTKNGMLLRYNTNNDNVECKLVPNSDVAMTRSMSSLDRLAKETADQNGRLQGSQSVDAVKRPLVSVCDTNTGGHSPHPHSRPVVSVCDTTHNTHSIRPMDPSSGSHQPDKIEIRVDSPESSPSSRSNLRAGTSV